MFDNDDSTKARRPLGRRFAATLALVGGLFMTASAHAFPSIRSNFYAAYPSAVGTPIETLTTSNRTNHCGICHYNFSGGGARNPYGLAVQGTNRSVSAILALGPLDSDGDGLTNDQEITSLLFSNTPTFPGLTPSNVGLVSNVSATEINPVLVPNTTWNEIFDGDLSNDRLAPDAVALAEGDNVIVATQQGDAFGRDIDYLTVTVPPGLGIVALTVEGFDADANNLAFLGLVRGATFPVDAANALAEDLLGGAVFGASDIGLDLLPDIGTLPGAQGFPTPLGAGTFTIWLNQTGPPSTATLDVVVPEPAMGGSVAIGVLALAVMRGSRGGRPRCAAGD